MVISFVVRIICAFSKYFQVICLFCVCVVLHGVVTSMLTYVLCYFYCYDCTLAVACFAQASPRRCGGQGDLLAGVVGVLAAWSSFHTKNNNDDTKASLSSSSTDQQTKLTVKNNHKNSHNVDDAKNTESIDSSWLQPPNSLLLAAYGGSLVTRMCAFEAFKRHKRSTLVSDMILRIPEVSAVLFPVKMSAKI